MRPLEATTSVRCCECCVKNATVWYAPDQVRVDTGVLVPFFGEPAMTSTAASRLARVSGVAVIPLFFCRLADDWGYLLRFYPQLDDFPTKDELHDTARLMSILEGFVRECPAQYFWTHKVQRPPKRDARPLRLILQLRGRSARVPARSRSRCATSVTFCSHAARHSFNKGVPRAD